MESVACVLCLLSESSFCLMPRVTVCEWLFPGSCQTGWLRGVSYGDTFRKRRKSTEEAYDRPTRTFEQQDIEVELFSF